MATRTLSGTRPAAGTRTNVVRYGIPNGGFEIAPPFTAITSSSLVFIDGTAAGSTTNDNYGWITSINATGFQAYFDTTTFHSGTTSMHLQNTNTTGRGGVKMGNNASSGSISARVMESLLIPVAPNTKYVISAWIKTSNAVSGAVNGGWTRYTSSYGAIGGNFTLFGTNNGTQNWTFQSNIITTGATDAYFQLVLNNNTAGNVSDAWFDDIFLSPIVRTLI